MFSSELKYSDMKRLYSEYFSLGYLNCDLSKKFALISLVGYVTYKSKMKNPDTTCYSVLMKLNEKINLPEDYIKGLSVVCEDFMYGCTEFPLFGLKGKEILVQIEAILKEYLPF